MNISKIINLHVKWLKNEPDGERADLSNADLSNANLSNANLRDADLSNADLSNANLRDADLSNANLSNANLRDANLRDADLSNADLSNANLSNADLSNADGLLSAIDYLESHFEKTSEGYIAYKTFGGEYNPPEKWVLQSGSVITENVNFDRTRECGCGINVAPLSWVKERYAKNGENIWRVLIRYEWLVGVCVPYHTDGKIRCEKVELIEIVNEEA